MITNFETLLAEVATLDAVQMQQVLQACAENLQAQAESTYHERHKFYPLREAASFAFTAAQSLKS